MDPLGFFEQKLGLTPALGSGVLSRALSRGGEFAEIFLEYRVAEQISLEEGLIKNPTRTVSQGAGVRVTWQERTGYAYTAELTAEELHAAADTASHIVQQARDFQVSIGSPSMPTHDLYEPGMSLVELPLPEKLDLLRRADAAARAHDPRVCEVRVSLSSEVSLVAILNSEGLWVCDRRPLTRLGVSAVAQSGRSRQMGQKGGGGRVTKDFFQSRPPEFFASEAARQAIVALSAAPAPAGEMDVVLGPGWPGILLHESVGHGLEADFIRKGTSAFAGRVGQCVASPACTVVDSGAIPHLRGSLNVDDEGTTTGSTVLIENGILRQFMQDRLSARIAGVSATGNGRRESYQHVPLPRMTNTYLLGGNQDPAEILASVRKGLYAANFGGGQVDITSGKFVFSASEAYLIEDGRITRPVQGATLIGHGPDILQRVAAVGNDLRFDEGMGTCGKDGQYVPVGVGMPTVKLSAVTVGGTALAPAAMGSEKR